MQSRYRKISKGIFKTWLMVIKGIFLLILPATVALAEEISDDYNYGLGTLQMLSQSPAQSLRLTLPMVVPGDIKPGWGIHIHSTWTNVWANENEYLLDYEMLNTLLVVSYGFDTRLGIALAFNNRDYFGGGMDGFIQSFHDTFGISQDGRDDAPKDRKIVRFLDPQTGQTVTEISAHDLCNNSIDLLLNYNISHGSQTWPSLNAYGAVSYSLDPADVFKDGNQADFGFGLGSAKQWSKTWFTYGAVGFATFDDWEMRDSTANVERIEFEDFQFTGMFSLSWLYTPTFAIIAQYLYDGPAIENINNLDEPSHEIHLGFKWNALSYGVIEFALIENIITLDNSPDFGLHLGWSYVF